MAQGPAEASTAGPSTPRVPKISGVAPGMLDPTQAARLYRSPGSRLSFASFDPRAATAQDVPDLRKLSLNEELYRPKRVVIETTSIGKNFWRFVPSAHKDEDVTDEGQWPRVVEICGQLVECSQDQWDIYKLDPLYNCTVRAYPNLTVITRITPEIKTPSASRPMPKRRVHSQSPEGTMPPPNPRKKVHKSTSGFYSGEEASEEDEVEVEEMIIDDGFHFPRPRSTGPSEKAKKLKEKIQRNRKDRREKMARRAERLGKQDEEIPFDFSSNAPDNSRSVPPELAAKRKVNSLFDSLRSQGDPDPTRPAEDEYLRNASNYVHTKHSKRTRTVSPSSARRDLEAKRLQRERQKRERREKELETRRQEKEARFLSELYADIPEVNGASGRDGEATQEVKNDSDDQQDTQNGRTEEETEEIEEAAREAAIAESRRKLAELEADRPLWEQEARKRMERERAEEGRRQQKVEESRRAAAQEEAKRKARATPEETMQHEEALKREREEMSRREREKRQRQQRWTYGPWTPQRALDRYKALSEIFDTTKFSEKEPLTADAVPWPVLQSPATFSVEDVDWASVEKFFETVKLHMRAQDYKSFVEKSHRRFHPDRWRSRSLLKSVIDETQRSCMEVAANTVTQAITPLWQASSGR